MFEVYNKAKEMLRSAYNNADPDAIAAIDGGFEEDFCWMFNDCYTWKEFCTWFIDYDLDIARDFRFADVRSFDDIIADIDNGETDPEGTYDLDVEGWENLDRDQKIERIKESADCLMIGDNGLCISW